MIVYFFLYESSDLSLESVDMMYTDPACKPWTSRSWAPTGFSTRGELVESDRQAHQRKSPEGVEEARTEKVGANGHSNGYFDGAVNSNGVANGDGAPGV